MFLALKIVWKSVSLFALLSGHPHEGDGVGPAEDDDRRS